MPRPRRKPFLRWAPLPWLVLVLLMLATGSLHDVGADGAYLVGLVVTALFAAAFVVALTAAARRRSPNFTAEGGLKSLEGLELVRPPAAGHPIGVADVARHRIAVGAALARSSAPPPALLVPGAGNWWNLRCDVAVYLLADDGFHHVGRLPDQAQLAWQSALDALRAAGRYAVVPATITGDERSYAVDLQLEGLKEVA